MQIITSDIKMDHPRPCGEKGLALMDKALNEGSPPPMRGKVQAIIALLGALRITPAHAGKSTQ